MKPAKLTRKRLSEELAGKICRHIVRHGLKPGDRLLTEQEMADRFGVSRVVVREATKALDFLGIISAVPRRGMVLNSFNFQRVSEYFGFHFALSDYPKEDLLKARVVIETGALYYTAQAMRTRPELYDELIARVEAADVHENLEDWIEHDIAFHRALVEAAGIEPLAAFAELLQVFFRKFYDRVAKGLFDRGKKGHRQIIDALRDGQVDQAINLLRHHLGWYEEDA